LPKQVATTLVAVSLAAAMKLAFERASGADGF